jgi:hypothetical protein
MEGMIFKTNRSYPELLSFIATMLGVPFGPIDFHNQLADTEERAKKERVEARETECQTIDAEKSSKVGHRPCFFRRGRHYWGDNRA